MLRPDSKCVKALVAFAAACLIAAPASAALINLTPTGTQTTSGPVLLSSLTTDPTATIVVGDKVFTGFSYSATNDMPAATLVNVLGFKDPVGNWGLRFQGAFLDLPGGPNSDAHIGFVVEASDPLKLISDAHLNLQGAAVGEDSFFSVVESFTNTSGNSAGQMKATISTLGAITEANPLEDLTDFILFNPPQKKLFVVKDILAVAAALSTEPAQGSVIDQSFSQIIIPEPATFVLAGLSGIAMVVAARRRG